MVKVNPWWFIWLTGFYSSDLRITLFLQKLHYYTFHSYKLSLHYISLLLFKAAHFPKKHLKCHTYIACFETGRQQWRHTQVSVAFAHMLDLLFRFQSWFSRLLQGVCHHFSSEAQQGIPNNTSLAMGKKVLSSQGFSGKISNNRVKHCVSEPELEK